jgi:hypothetical protein
MDFLFSFIEEQCVKYNIDESHGLKHAKGTFAHANEILESLEDVSDNERKVALFAAALHDICDSKYTPEKEAAEEIRIFLLGVNWQKDHIDAIINIITSMSYSKLKKATHSGKPEFPDHGKWQRAYHVARHADLLEGYIVARCVLYNQRIFPLKSIEEHWEQASELFSRRVFTYVSDGWIFLPRALEMVKYLEFEARRCLSEKSMDWPEPVIHEK